MIQDEDLVVHKLSHGNGIDNRFYASNSGHNIQRLVSNMVPSFTSKRPSARELNLLKRKAKLNSKDQTKGWTEDGDLEVPYAQSVTAKGSESLSSSKVDSLTQSITSMLLGFHLCCYKSLRSVY